MRLSLSSEVDVENLGSFLDTEIVSRLERVPGVAEVGYFGGGSQQMTIRIDPDKLVRYRLSISEVVAALRQSSAVISAGSVDQGKRTYAVRTQADLFTLQTAGTAVIRNDMTADGQLVPILLQDIADLSIEMQKRTSFRRLNGENALILNVLREQGTNVVQTMQRLQEVIETLNRDTLAKRGLVLNLVYDETKYIESALNLVQQNIWVGGLLALSVLILFLRTAAPTLIIAAAIPISVIGTFVAIAALGLSINVISLAGLAFAVGMVVDASIVSQENIFRLRQSGMDAAHSAFHGARQVWAPILGSALTTVLVFIPVIMLDLPVGQLFRDIGIAISVAVLISVLVSATVIPSISAALLKGDADR
ncbi:MAG: efflux RND transporter permease subunit, partial [Candidatus Puniceispirillaceae bacterium]